MNNIFCTLLLSIHLNICSADPIPNTIRQSVSNEYIIIDSVQADFNIDKRTDWAVVVQKRLPIILQSDTSCYGNSMFYPKKILFFFNEKSEYKLVSNIGKIFGTCNWGIQGNDPFSSIGSSRNLFTINFIVGGTLRCELSYTFKYQNNNWYLVTAKSSVYQIPNSDLYVTDINLVSGSIRQYVMTGNRKRHKKSKLVPITPLLTIDALIPETDIDPLWDWAKG